MNENLIKEAMAVFDTPEKWAAFCVLCDNRNEMLKVWLSELTDKLQKMLSPEWVAKSIDVEHHDNIAIKLHLKEYGDRALSIVWYMNNPRIVLWIDSNKHNSDLAKSLLKDKLHLDDSYVKGNDWDLYSKDIKELRGNRYSVLYTLSRDDKKCLEIIFKDYICKLTEQTVVFEDICKSVKK